MRKQAATARRSAMKPTGDAFLRGKPRSRVPHEFVLDALEPIGPVTKPMFGCLAVYVKEKVVLILRNHRDLPADNGVWLATAVEHHDSLRREFPHMRSIQIFRTPLTSWQVLPADASDFEESALRACELVLARDSRIGRVPARRSISRKTRKAKTPAVKKTPTMKQRRTAKTTR
jgi:hypothetical protein